MDTPIVSQEILDMLDAPPAEPPMTPNKLIWLKSQEDLPADPPTPTEP